MGHYSQAVRAGDLLFVSGQPGIDLSGAADPNTARPVPGGFEAEWRQALWNLQAILEAAGSGLEHVVKVTTFLTDLANGEAANRLFAEYFPVNPPARSAPVVVLPRGLLLSVEAIAVVPQ
jgi:2-iminobutanoate/2-iminopropanoate deaminase